MNEIVSWAIILASLEVVFVELINNHKTVDESRRPFVVNIHKVK
jgi:hypothetical protein